MPTAKKILFSAFDIGGGNSIFPVVKGILKNKSFKALCLAGGPSKEVFKKEKVKYIDADLLNNKELKILIKNFKPDLFVSGTSNGVQFDKKILLDVKNTGTKTIYILDYWANYWERFSGTKKDFKYLSDTICVMDKKAKNEMIADGFDAKIIAITGNPFFDVFLKNIKKKIESKSIILFLSQPYIGKKDKFGYDEFEVLNGILKTLDVFALDFKVIIRAHPKEKKGKFDKYLTTNVKIDYKTPMEELLSRAGLVIGMNSMVLFQAAVAGKKVISYQPNLKTKDFSVCGMFGLGKLATEEKDLMVLLKKYFDNKLLISKKSLNLIIPNATRNVIDVIKKYIKYEQNK